jgi:hypothetical protein
MPRARADVATEHRTCSSFSGERPAEETFKSLGLDQSEGDDMQKALSIKRTCGAVAIACLVALLGSRGAAQDENPPVNEVYQAQAMGQGTQVGKTFNVTINIERYSTEAERQVLLAAFRDGGSEGLYNALNKMHAKGRIAITGTLGHDISFARRIPQGDGYVVRVVTNRPINIGEQWVNGVSTSYNLSSADLTIVRGKDVNSGVLVPAAQLQVDKKTGEVGVETYGNPWKLANVVDRTKK